MSFQLQPFDPKSLAASYNEMIESSQFAGVQLREFNRIKADDGQLFALVNGQELRRADRLHVVIAAFQHDDFNKSRRQFYVGKWNPSQEAGKKPDCMSFDGSVPDAGVAAPQSASCSNCPNNAKNAEGYTGCSYRKSFVMFLVNVDANGGAVVDMSTPFVFDASSKSLFTEFQAATRSGGLNKIIPLLIKEGLPVIEGVVFELGFFQGSKAPVVRPVGGLPVAETRQVLAAAQSDSVKQLLAPIGAAPAAPAAPALAAPVQQVAAQVAYTAPVQQAPVQQVPVQQVPVQQAPVWGAPDEQAPSQWDAPQAAAPLQQAPLPPVAAGPVAAEAPASNKAKALGAFDSLIATR